MIAGWAAGYTMAIATTFALVFLLTRVSRTGWMDQFVAREVSAALVAVPISIGAMLGWTMIGLVLGALWLVGDFESKGGAFGSPSWQFTLIVAVLALLPLPPLIMFVRRYWWLWTVMSMLFAGLFGWVMPVLAER